MDKRKKIYSINETKALCLVRAKALRALEAAENHGSRETVSIARKEVQRVQRVINHSEHHA